MLALNHRNFVVDENLPSFRLQKLIGREIGHNFVSIHLRLLLHHGTGCDECPVDGRSGDAHVAVEEN